MRIVIDGRIIASSTGRYVERLLTYLEKIDTKNEYVVLVPTKDLGFWKPTANNFSVQPCDVAHFSLAEQTTFLRQLNALNADLVHFCMPEQPVLYRGKKVTTFHDLSQLRVYNPTKNWLVYRFKQLVGRFVFHWVLRTSSHIITDSHYSEQDIVQFSPSAEGKISTIYLSTDPLSRAHKEPYLLPSDNFLLYVGQQSEHKNLRRLIQAHQQLLNNHPDLLLVLVGKLSANGKLLEQWLRVNQYKNVVFTGYVSDAQLGWLYEHARAYTFSSLMEGFGLPGLEAMQHGTPLVSSNATCSPEIFSDAAVYFDPTSVEDMAKKIALVVEDEALRHQLVEKGYTQVKKYSWQRMAEETHAVYEAALRNT